VTQLKRSSSHIDGVNSASALPCLQQVEAVGMDQDRRNTQLRSEVVRSIINRVVQNPSVTLTVDTLQQWVGLPVDAADRILRRLASSGLVREVNRGVWARGSWPGAQREWY
jgi:hypothetical protein